MNGHRNLMVMFADFEPRLEFVLTASRVAMWLQLCSWTLDSYGVVPRAFYGEQKACVSVVGHHTPV
jgi:hypothetical protein